MDASVRVTMRVRGQANYRAPKEVRNQAPVPACAALRRVFGVRGRTGAVLVLELLRSEESEVLAARLANQIKDEHRAQTVSVATDQPPRKLCLAMRAAFCNLCFLFPDPVHLVIVHNQACRCKWTQGEGLLRVIMKLFNKLDASKHAYYGGAPFTGAHHPSHTAHQHIIRSMVLTGPLPVPEAEYVVSQMEPETPWYYVVDVTKGVAVLPAMYRNSC